MDRDGLDRSDRVPTSIPSGNWAASHSVIEAATHSVIPNEPNIGTSIPAVFLTQSYRSSRTMDAP
jgi:hypothetical protein